ncbi:MAG: hypothetical protein IJ812_07940 [Schwartzia sp.]|nr:hypothetical protein [Schwartzia sp. (in: firmicutes)]
MAKIPKNLSDKDMFKGWQEAPTIEETFREKYYWRDCGDDINGHEING